MGGAVSNHEDFSHWRDEDGEELLPQAIRRLGPLEPGEIYGFVPALQLGGRNHVDSLQRVKAPEHLMMLAQLSRFTLTRLTDPEPGHPYGRIEPVRLIGPQ